MLILLVEDDDAKARVIERVLRGATAGVDVQRATNLVDAIDAIEGTDGPELPDIVITDWNFPTFRERAPTVGNGASVIVHARAAGTPVAVVSGRSNRDTPEPAPWIHFGRDGWMGDLVAFVEHHLASAGAA